jgi:hypothetical protein
MMDYRRDRERLNAISSPLPGPLQCAAITDLPRIITPGTNLQKSKQIQGRYIYMSRTHIKIHLYSDVMYRDGSDYGDL